MCLQMLSSWCIKQVNCNNPKSVRELMYSLNVRRNFLGALNNKIPTHLPERKKKQEQCIKHKKNLFLS